MVPQGTGECANSRFLVEYVWRPTCKSLERRHQGLREDVGVRTAWRHRRTRKYASMWGRHGLVGQASKRLG